MSGIEVVAALKNLYLYNNKIRKIEGIESMKNLTHLYLENNLISSISGLPAGCLRKLYLNENDIEVVENVECIHLTELHVASQRLPPYQPLRFAPSVLDTISSTLLVLNVANNNLDSVVDVLRLENLEKLNMAKNRISNIDMCLALMQLENLKELDLRGNPATKMPKYMENLIANSPQFLGKLDGKEVVENHRTMLKNLVAFKSRGLRSAQNYAHPSPQQEQYEDMGMMGTATGGYAYPQTDEGPQEEWGTPAGGAIDYQDGGFR